GVGDLEVVVGDRLRVEAAEQPDLVEIGVVAREPPQRLHVPGVERQHQVDLLQVVGVEDLGAVVGDVQAVAAGDVGGAVVGCLAHVPSAGAGRADRHAVLQTGLADLVAEDRLPDRGPADVPAADDTDRVVLWHAGHCHTVRRRRCTAEVSTAQVDARPSTAPHPAGRPPRRVLPTVEALREGRRDGARGDHVGGCGRGRGAGRGDRRRGAGALDRPGRGGLRAQRAARERGARRRGGGCAGSRGTHPRARGRAGGRAGGPGRRRNGGGVSGSGVAPVADGSPSSTASHQAAQELVVLGHGIGSTARLEVTTADIRRCAGRVRTVAERVRAAAATARLAAAGVSATAHLTTGVGGAAAGAAWQAVGQAGRQVGELLDLAARMEATADRYDAAEARAASTVWRITRPPLRLPLLLPWAHVGIAWGLVARDAMLHGQVLPTRHGVGMGLRETIWAFTGIDRGVPAVGRVLAGAVDVWVDHDVEVRQVDPVAASGGDAPVSDPAGGGTAIEDLYPDNGHVEPGTIRIDRVTGADGAVSWLVLLPGTQGSLVADHGFDWSSNPGAMLGATTASTAVVVQAMRLAGIRPGQPVMIA